MTPPTHLLDANPCIHVMRPRGNVLVKQRYVHHTGLMAVCSIVVGELYLGAEQANNPAAERATVDAFLTPFLPSLPVDDAVAREYARVRADLEARGLPIGDNDTLIAAVALVHRLKLVTHNTAQFSRVHGLDIEDWEVP